MYSGATSAHVPARFTGHQSTTRSPSSRPRSSALARERNAVILAHNYERPEVQDVADFVGDSLGLSREAAKTDADVIVFCGVHFMAETAAILSPAEDGAAPRPRRRLLARRDDRRRQLCARGRPSIPGAVVVSYVNTTAEVKAESDYCCTSGNAVEVVNSIPADTRDSLSPRHVPRRARAAGDGAQEHARVDGRVSRARGHRSGAHSPAAQPHPGAEFLIHPECGCSTSVLEAMSAGDVDPEGVQILSTEGMIRRPALSSADEFIVATEVGILHRLRRENPSKRFFAANERASCAYMKVTTLPKVRESLERSSITSPCRRTIAARARRAIERMVAIGGSAKQPLSPAPGVDPANSHSRSVATLTQAPATGLVSESLRGGRMESLEPIRERRAVPRTVTPMTVPALHNEQHVALPAHAGRAAPASCAPRSRRTARSTTSPRSPPSSPIAARAARSSRASAA